MSRGHFIYFLSGAFDKSTIGVSTISVLGGFTVNNFRSSPLQVSYKHPHSSATNLVTLCS